MNEAIREFRYFIRLLMANLLLSLAMAFIHVADAIGSAGNGLADLAEATLDLAEAEWMDGE